MKFTVLLLLGVFFLSGCTSKPPLEEYTLAKTALDSAQTSGANKFAPGFWFKAEDSYRKGEQSFKDGRFEESKKHFELSREFSEKAENKARFDRSKSGEDFP